MINIFTDDTLNNSLKKNGYVKFDLISSKDIEKVMELYKQKKVKDENTYNNKEKIESLTPKDFLQLHEEIRPIIMPKLQVLCPELNTLFVEFLIKRPQGGNIPGHQDWLFTSRSSFNTPSLSLFIAISDINLKNGTLGLIPGSHLIKDLTPPPSPSPYAPIPLLEHSQLIFEYFTFEEMKAGQAIIFYNNTIHGSYNNQTDLNRIALRIALYHKSSELYHYYMNPRSNADDVEMIQYQVSPSFFSNYRNESIVKYFKEKKELPQKEIKREQYFYPRYTTSKLEEIFKNMGLKKNTHFDLIRNDNPKKKSFLSRFFSKK